MFKRLASLIMVLMLLLILSGCVSAEKKQARAEKRAQKAQLRSQKEQIRAQKIADEQVRLEKMEGWEYVRVEKRIPSKDCVYKLQLACGEKDAASCYTWYKQMAKVYDCNTVVVTEDVRSESSKGGFGFVAGVGGGGGYKTNQSIAALADFYVCPEYKPGEQK